MVTCQELSDGNASPALPSQRTDRRAPFERSAFPRCASSTWFTAGRTPSLSCESRQGAPLPAMPSGSDDHLRRPPPTRRGTLVDSALLGPVQCVPGARPHRCAGSALVESPPAQECASRSLGDAFSLAAVAPGSSRTPALSCPVRSTNTRCVRRSVGHPRRLRRR